MRGEDGSCMALDELGLDFSYLPTLRVYGYLSVSLIDGCSVPSGHEARSSPPVVPIDALEDYIEVRLILIYRGEMYTRNVLALSRPSYFPLIFFD